MYTKFYKKASLLRLAAAGLLLWAGMTGGQNLLAVMDLQNTGNVSQQLIGDVCDKIGASLAADTNYMLFDRTMIPELLKQLNIGQSAASCSEIQCLSLIGSMIGANTVIGGTIAQTGKTTEITLNCVDVAGKKLKNTVSLSAKTSVELLIDKEIPALAKSLMQTTAPQSVAVENDEEKNMLHNPLMRNPLSYVGVVLLGGAAAGAYYYKYHNNSVEGADGPDVVDVPKDPVQPPEESTEIPNGDAPQRSRGE